MALKIRTKVVLIAGIILFAALGANTLIGTRVFTREYLRALAVRGQDLATALGADLDRLLGLGIPLDGLVGFEEQCRDLVRTHPDVAYAKVLDATGAVLFESDAPAGRADRRGPPATFDAGDGLRVANVGGRASYEVAAPVRDGHGVRVGTVVIGFPGKLISEKTRTQMLYAAGVLLASLAVAILALVALLSWWVTTPLRTVIGMITNVRELHREGERRIDRPGSDELGQLSRAFNDMMDRLDESSVPPVSSPECRSSDAWRGIRRR